ncbi:alpha/beta fold hydrolase [Salinibacterium sp. SWN248]|uniref:alpha/beta fold hydrolase n=1 Tax=Salinibacterium sp. SWN248 TaxID=2792056 RepID=UPI0018CCE65D|nr:alpha/beta fold hydrolase [Salinibacterium sp. SWN248]MBH0022563.1 alpha/beta fold hydrolase [Salinibacterium sp. SWN248]
MPKFTVPRTDHSYTDAHGVTIHYYGWQSPKAHAVLQLTHGLGDHARRYEYLAQALVAAGYTVYADDHRGHGATGLDQNAGDASKLGKLGKGGLRAATENIRDLTKIIRAENPDLPLALLGHSWGSLMVQDVINHHSAEYEVAILTGTAHRTFAHMNSGNLNAKHKDLGTTGYEWLSRDPQIAEDFVHDPLTFYADALKLFGPIDGMRLLGRPAKHLKRDIPILIMIGDEDSLGGEASIEALAADYVVRSKLTDVEAIVYPGARHEIFNETNKDDVITDLVVWLDARLKPVHPDATPPAPAHPEATEPK